jgi:hypothetical protein
MYRAVIFAVAKRGDQDVAAARAVQNLTKPMAFVARLKTDAGSDVSLFRNQRVLV